MVREAVLKAQGRENSLLPAYSAYSATGLLLATLSLIIHPLLLPPLHINSKQTNKNLSHQRASDLGSVMTQPSFSLLKSQDRDFSGNAPAKTPCLNQIPHATNKSSSATTKRYHMPPLMIPYPATKDPIHCNQDLA